MQELNIRQSEQIEENIRMIKELNDYCYKWAILQDEISRMKMYVDALKEKQNEYKDEIARLRETNENNNGVLMETERQLKEERIENNGTKARVMVKEAEISETAKEVKEQRDAREHRITKLRDKLRSAE